MKYKTYWIKTNPLNGYIWIEKDGVSIGSAVSIVAAQKIIDDLTAPNWKELP